MGTGRPRDPRCDGWRRGELVIRGMTDGDGEASRSEV